MSRLDPEIWKNQTLGAANAGPFLPELEVQEKENANARLEGREPRVAVYENRYPQTPPSGSVPADIEQIKFINPVDAASPVAKNTDFSDSVTSEEVFDEEDFE